MAEAERIARDCYGLAVAVQPLSGERDCNFRLRSADRREYVLKIIDREATPEAIDCQIRVLRHLAEADPALPVPRVHATAQGAELGTIQRDDGSYTTCLMGYLPGQLLGQRAKRIINILASEARVLIGYEGPEADVLKLRPPMPFRAEHADVLVDALDAAATRVEAHAAEA